MKWLIALLLVAVYVLHQDSLFVPNAWSRDDLIFGVLPYGLAYHAGYALLASLTMAFLVKFAWPSQLEQEVGDVPETAGGLH